MLMTISKMWALLESRSQKRMKCVNQRAGYFKIQLCLKKFEMMQILICQGLNNPIRRRGWGGGGGSDGHKVEF